ncbi:MAG: MYXO-CTERM sorting domain-containing protein, partial [Persicimonas sp.]
SDGDGYGTDDEEVRACNQPDGFVDNDDDCDDDDEDAYPGSSTHNEDCEPRYELSESDDESGCSTGGHPGATGWLLLIGLAAVGLRRMRRRNSFS